MFWCPSYALTLQVNPDRSKKYQIRHFFIYAQMPAFHGDVGPRFANLFLIVIFLKQLDIGFCTQIFQIRTNRFIILINYTYMQRGLKTSFEKLPGRTG